MLENWLLGIGQLGQWQVVLAMFAGVAMGIVVGAMPGLSGPTGLALMIPFTYILSPIVAIVLLISIYVGAEYGGSITAITINTPGTPSGAITAIDGYPMTEAGQTGRALSISIMSSTTGGVFSTICLVLFSIPLAQFAIAFGPVQYFALGIFGLTIVASLVSGNWIKGVIAALIGLLIETIGAEPMTGTQRFTFGQPALWEGISFVSAMLGLFAITEVFLIIESEVKTRLKSRAKFTTERISWREFAGLWKTLSISSVIGTIIGVMPGAGASIGSIVAYNEAKRISPNHEKFGKGAPEGVCASETANNATVGGALVPLLTLGVPGSGSTAILLGALMLHNISPGPQLFVKNPDIVYGIFTTLFLANFVMLFLGLKFIRLWLKVVEVSPPILAALIFSVAFIGAFSVGGSVGDVVVMLIIGVLGYVLRKFKFPLIPLVIGLVLGELIEISLRRALILSDGSFQVFFTDPISLGLLIAAALSLIYAIVRDIRAAKAKQKFESL
ncbi:MAG: tripartite tricarboxylate transporter permease [Rhodospirillales bacterium]|mgnify:CR=1 FL=1|nr:tripartite tricarboxylate transporter permease [Rhodospirillales bacterium]